MTITTPNQLVEEFKKSGEFDRLRRELLNQFRNSDAMGSLLTRAEDIARQKFASDQKLQYMSEAYIARELMQELDRYPIVERAVAELPALSDPSFAASVRTSVTGVLQVDRGQTTAVGDKSADVNGGPSAAISAAVERMALPTPTSVEGPVAGDAKSVTPVGVFASPSKDSNREQDTARAVRFEVDGITGGPAVDHPSAIQERSPDSDSDVEMEDVDETP